MLRNRGPTSDFVRGYLLLVSDLAAWWRSAFAVKLSLDPSDVVNFQYCYDCSTFLSIVITAELSYIGAENRLIFAIFANISLQKAKIAFESIEFSKCLRNLIFNRGLRSEKHFQSCFL